MRETYRLNGLHVDRVAPDASNPGGPPPLLLVHGAGHGAWCWEHWLDALDERGWEAHALSLRGHPGSRPVEAREFRELLQVEDYADDVAQVAAHIGKPVVVVGHSMGGIVVQRYVTHEDPRDRSTAGMVLLASVAPGQLGPMRASPVNTRCPYLPDRESARRLYFQGDTPDVDRALERLVGESPSVVNQYSLGGGVPVNPARVGCPVLVVTAEHDRTNVFRDGRIADYFGGDHLHEDIGHDLMLDKGWETVLDHVLAWVRTRVPHGPPAATARDVGHE